MKVNIEDLTLAYGDVNAVDSLDLVIPDGESVVLLGKSGCGKTSTMRCVAGLEQPVRGRISIGDRVVFDAAASRNVPSHKRNVGMVFQSYAVWPHKTVLENVMFPLTIKRIPKPRARKSALSFLEIVGLAHLADRGASALSGGQMQRVALARSLAMEPSVMLLDEPLSNLDARLRDDLRIELRRIQQEQGLTSLYVTHDQQEALALGDKVAIMQEGRITQLATPVELYTSPASASIATFIGVANVFAAKQSSPGKYKLEGFEFSVSAVPVNLGTSPLSVCFRPDAVRVNDSGVSTETNSWPGTVRAAAYQGDSIRYQVELVPGLVVEALERDTSSFRPLGSQAVVSVQPERVLVLRQEVDGIAASPLIPDALADS